MSIITDFMGSGWSWLAGIGGVLAALLMAWFGGKKVGTVKAQAAADVETAKKETAEAQQANTHQTEIIRVVKDAQQNNNAISDSTARDRMRNSKYHSAD